MQYPKAYDADDQVTLKGVWNIQVYGPDGVKKYDSGGKNVVATVGKEFLARFLQSATTSSVWSMKYVAIGSDNTAAAVGNTALGTELSRHTGVVTYTSGAIYSVIATFAAGSGTGSVIEYGVFSANTGGTMLSRYVDSGVVTKGASDTLRAEVQITFS
jgi:hypothetical protein